MGVNEVDRRQPIRVPPPTFGLVHIIRLAHHMNHDGSRHTISVHLKEQALDWLLPVW
jgi:hypothetical protein